MITLDRLREVCVYDAETGVFTGIINRGKRYKVGMPFGRLERKGYLQVSIDGTTYQLQRLAWLYFYGSLPNDQVDHINCDPSDNRISNLRPATIAQNNRNRPIQKNNTSGYKGVGFCKKHERWFVAILSNGKTHWDGFFDTPESAFYASIKLRDSLHGDFARHDHIEQVQP